MTLVRVVPVLGLLPCSRRRRVVRPSVARTYPRLRAAHTDNPTTLAVIGFTCADSYAAGTGCVTATSLTTAAAGVAGSGLAAAATVSISGLAVAAAASVSISGLAVAAAASVSISGLAVAAAASVSSSSRVTAISLATATGVAGSGTTAPTSGLTTAAGVAGSGLASTTAAGVAGSGTTTGAPSFTVTSPLATFSLALNPSGLHIFSTLIRLANSRDLAHRPRRRRPRVRNGHLHQHNHQRNHNQCTDVLQRRLAAVPPTTRHRKATSEPQHAPTTPNKMLLKTITRVPHVGSSPAAGPQGRPHQLWKLAVAGHLGVGPKAQPCTRGFSPLNFLR
jgi:hypothetical protein